MEKFGVLEREKTVLSYFSIYAVNEEWSPSFYNKGGRW